MAGVRWPSPPLLINTRGGHHRKGGGRHILRVEKQRDFFREKREIKTEGKKEERNRGENKRGSCVFSS
jgi:hypothetical protein